MIIISDITKGLECYINANFTRACNKKNSEDSENMLSRTGYMIKYANYPILWISRLQSEIALLSCESEYIAPLTA